MEQSRPMMTILRRKPLIIVEETYNTTISESDELSQLFSKRVNMVDEEYLNEKRRCLEEDIAIEEKELGFRATFQKNNMQEKGQPEGQDVDYKCQCSPFKLQREQSSVSSDETMDDYQQNTTLGVENDCLGYQVEEINYYDQQQSQWKITKKKNANNKTKNNQECGIKKSIQKIVFKHQKNAMPYLQNNLYF